MKDIDRLETIDHQFRRANELAATDPEAAALLYAVASEWFRSLFSGALECPARPLEGYTINFQAKE